MERKLSCGLLEPTEVQIRGPFREPCSVDPDETITVSVEAWEDDTGAAGSDKVTLYIDGVYASSGKYYHARGSIDDAPGELPWETIEDVLHEHVRSEISRARFHQDLHDVVTQSDLDDAQRDHWERLVSTHGDDPTAALITVLRHGIRAVGYQWEGRLSTPGKIFFPPITSVKRQE